MITLVGFVFAALHRLEGHSSGRFSPRSNRH
jgi:hypothetical protein